MLPKSKKKKLVNKNEMKWRLIIKYYLKKRKRDLFWRIEEILKRDSNESQKDMRFVLKVFPRISIAEKDIQLPYDFGVTKMKKKCPQPLYKSLLKKKNKAKA